MRTIAEMSRDSTVRPAALLGLALGGVLVGHSLTYRVLVPDAHARAVTLADTGHAYLGGANMLGLVAAVAALSILFLGRLLRGTAASPRVAVRLMAFQLTTFAAMEVLERLGSGAGVRQLLPALLVGIPTQIVVAGIVAVLVRCILRAASIVADRTPGGSDAWSVDGLVRIVQPLAHAPLAPVGGAVQGRAPPLAS